MARKKKKKKKRNTDIRVGAMTADRLVADCFSVLTAEDAYKNNYNDHF